MSMINIAQEADMRIVQLKENELLTIGGIVKVLLFPMVDGEIRLGFEAPSHIEIDREEVRQRKQRRRSC